jgi:DNA-binding response OmpR family regulator
MRTPEILIVEDDFILNFSIRETLETFGYLVQSVYCGEAAMEALNRRQYLSALLTDIDLGAGPDGFNVACCARAAYPALPVLFISGTAAAVHHERGVSRSEFIAKPFHPHQIVSALQRLISREAA